VTVLIWLLSRLDDDPDSWTTSAVFGALVVACGYLGNRSKERRRIRARTAAADQEGRWPPAPQSSRSFSARWITHTATAISSAASASSRTMSTPYVSLMCSQRREICASSSPS
jgi:hypothetical protein